MCGNAPTLQRGMALISSLLLLLVVTILALGMFHSFTVEEKIAGNVREKQRALHAAESAQQYAEHWLANGNASLGVGCTAALSANLGQGQICVAPLMPNNDRTAIATQPWPALTVSYNPGVSATNPAGVMNVNGGGGGAPNTYVAVPQFYIYYVGTSADGLGALYQIDAVGYGANSNAVAIVESTYEVGTGVIDHGAL
jgi:type IV pilus assembly protein PilX